MITKAPSLLVYSSSTLKSRKKNLVKNGFKLCDAKKILVKNPLVFNRKEEVITTKINQLLEMGYTKKEVIKLILGCNSILNYSIEQIISKYKGLKEMGFTDNEVRTMTVNLPSLYGYTLENTKDKIEYLRSIQLGLLILEDTKRLMMSLDLMYARYEYYKNEKNKIMTEDNYSVMFKGNKQFEKEYKITKEQLLEKYPRNKR